MSVALRRLSSKTPSAVSILSISPARASLCPPLRSAKVRSSHARNDRYLRFAAVQHLRTVEVPTFCGPIRSAKHPDLARWLLRLAGKLNRHSARPGTRAASSSPADPLRAESAIAPAYGQTLVLPW